MNNEQRRFSVKKSFFFLVILITIAAVIGVYFIGKGVAAYREQKSMHRFEAVVARVIDGDTVVTDSGEKIRLLGVDTPELHHPDFPEQPFAKEARQYVVERIGGKKCVFEYTDMDHYDKYGRTLAFIYIDGDLVNSELVKKGFGYASPNKYLSKTREFLILENIARKFRSGLWEYQEGGQKKK
jgi:micrococcal nuclease